MSEIEASEKLKNMTQSKLENVMLDLIEKMQQIIGLTSQEYGDALTALALIVQELRERHNTQNSEYMKK